MKKLLVLLAFIFLPSLASAQTHTFCATDTNCTWTGTETFSGDLLAKSGRPWYDVMAFGAKNDGATDDTAAIASAIAAANASGHGGIVFFPAAAIPGTNYYRVTSTCAATPFVITANGVEIRGVGGFGHSGTNMPSQIFAPSCNGDLFATSGSVDGFQVDNMQIIGPCQVSPCASVPNSRAFNVTGSQSSKFWSNQIAFWGLSGIFAGSGLEVTLEDNLIFACVYSRPAVDTGCVDLNSTDNYASNNFVSPSVPGGAGNIGNGHSYSWAIRAGGGFYTHNFAELGHHGWLVSGTFNRLTGNRSILQQGNGFVISGTENILTNNQAWADSQNANGTFDGFVVSAQNNVFTNNSCSNSGGNGNIIRHCFADSNSTGTATANENQYSNNRANPNGISGVLYSMTGTAPYRIDHPHRNAVQTLTTGALTLQCWVDADTQEFTNTLTGTVTITLSTTGAWNGCRFRVIRKVGGAFSIAVTGQTSVTALNQIAEYEFINGAWDTISLTPRQLPQVSLNKGTGAGNYTTASTTYVVADSTNLCLTVTIPQGWKLHVSMSGNLGTATAAVLANYALTDNAACSTANAGILVEGTVTTTAAAVLQPIALNWVINGDGAAHNIAIQYKTSNGADSATLLNSSATSLPTLVGWLTQSN